MGSGTTRTGARQQSRARHRSPDCDTAASHLARAHRLHVGCAFSGRPARRSGRRHPPRRPWRTPAGRRPHRPGRQPPLARRRSSGMITSVAAFRFRSIFHVPATKPSTVNVLIGSCVAGAMPRATAGSPAATGRHTTAAGSRSRTGTAAAPACRDRAAGHRGGRTARARSRRGRSTSSAEAGRPPRRAASGRTMPGRP